MLSFNSTQTQTIVNNQVTKFSVLSLLVLCTLQLHTGAGMKKVGSLLAMERSVTKILQVLGLSMSWEGSVQVKVTFSQMIVVLKESQQKSTNLTCERFSDLLRLNGINFNIKK